MDRKYNSDYYQDSTSRAGDNRPIPKWLEDFMGTDKVRGMIGGIPSYVLFAQGIPYSLGAYGQYGGESTRPTKLGQEIADSDARRMALQTMLDRYGSIPERKASSRSTQPPTNIRNQNFPRRRNDRPESYGRLG